MNRTELLEEKVLVGVERPAGLSALRVEKTDRRVRAVFGGEVVADSKRVLLVWEPRRLVVYYFPVEDVRMDLLQPTRHTLDSGAESETLRWDLQAGGRTAENAAWGYRDPDGERAALRGHVAFYWSKLDAWFEEDDEVFVHARDPYHRIDVLNSSREVRVVFGGQTVAVTRRARFLFETALPVRYYIPKEDVRTDLLQQSHTATACAYKGPTSRYWQVSTADGSVRDIAWSYEDPAPEVATIAGMVAFFNERVDAIYVDGKEMPRTQTAWSV
jgi:uncharacterized protein (DUF427 family)